MSQKVLKRWRKVRVEKLGEAIFSVVGGNCKILNNSNYRPQSSTWGKIACKLGEEFSEKIDRFWINTLWISNNTKLKDAYRNLCGHAGLEYRQDQSFNTEEGKMAYCICKRMEFADISKPDEDMVECAACSEWFHGLCVGILVEDFGEEKTYTCKACRNVNPHAFIPPVFNHQNRQRKKRTKKENKVTQRNGGARAGNQDDEVMQHDGVNNDEGKKSLDKRQEEEVTDSSEEELDNSSESVTNPIKRRKVTSRSSHGNIPNDDEEHGDCDDEDSEGEEEGDDAEYNDKGDVTHIILDGEHPTKPRIVAESSSTEEEDPEGHKNNNCEEKTGNQPAEHLNYDIPKRPTIWDIEDESSLHNDDLREETTVNDDPQVENVQEHNNLTKNIPEKRKVGEGNSSKPDDANEDKAKRAEVTTSEGEWSDSSGSSDSDTEDDVTIEEHITTEEASTNDREHQPVHFVIPAELFEEIRPKETENKSKQYRFQMKKSYWAPEVTKYFLKAAPQYKGCVLSFKSGHKVTGNATKGFVVSTHAICNKRKDKGCSMTYSMTMNNYKIGKDAKWIAKPTGIVKHNETIVAKRKLTGFARDEGKQELKTTKPTILYSKKRSKPEVDEEALDKGNHTEIQDVIAFRNLNKKRLQEEDLHEDFEKDLMERRRILQQNERLRGGSTNIDGYIQGLSLFPFVVTMYNHKQVQLLRDLLKLNSETVIHIDATGSLANPLPKSFGDKKVFYYAATVTSNEPGGAKVVPIFEFLTNKQSSREISMALNHFFQRYKENTGTSILNLGIKRVETDDQLALISATMDALSAGPIEYYLANAWHALQSRTPLQSYVHHICRRHAKNFLKNNVEEKYKNNPQSKKIFKKWSTELLNGRDLQDFCRNVKIAVLLCGRKYLTPDVQAAVAQIATGMQEQTQSAERPWDEVEFSKIDPSFPFYLRSPFGFFAVNECSDLGIKWREAKGRQKEEEERYYQHAEDTDKKISKDLPNPHYNTKFLDYLLKHIFPIGCLLDHSLLFLNDFVLTVDSNATSESWNKVIKQDELDHQLPMKVGRFLMAMEDVVYRRLVLFEDYVKKELKRRERIIQQRNKQYASVHTSNNAPSSHASSGLPSAANATPQENIPTEPADDFDIWKRKGKKLPPRADTTPLHGVLRIAWGGEAMLDDNTYSLTNTCSIDNQMQIVWMLYCCDRSFKEFLNTKAMEGIEAASRLIDIINALREREVTRARGILLQQLIRWSPPDEVGEDWDLFESEDKFVTAISELFQISQSRKCENDLCGQPSAEMVCIANGTVIRRPEMISAVLEHQKVEDPCTACNVGKCLVEIDWIGESPLPYFPYVLAQSDIEPCTEKDLVFVQSVLGQKYKVSAYTLLAGQHYTTIFCHRNGKYVYDGKKNSSLRSYPPKGFPNHRLSTVWLSRK